ncbi:MAG: hypothetical protein ACRDRJ_33735 [Streptosporangiaceae bacterium]
MADGGEPAARLRAEMVALLRERGSVSDPRVIAALGTVPRHVFVPGSELAEAYDNRAIVTHLRDGVPTSSASQPAIVAIMLEQLQARVGGTVLEIGAGGHGGRRRPDRGRAWRPRARGGHRCHHVVP